MEIEKGPSISRQLLCMKIRYWLYLVLFFQYTLVVFIFGCLGTRRWVRKGNDTTEWEGGLLSITDSNYEWKDLAYNSAKSKVCSLTATGASTLCSDFDHLYSGGVAYLFFDLLALLFIFVWMGQIAWALMEKPLKRFWIFFIAPGISFLSHIIGLAIWAGVTKAEFEPNCLSLTSNKLCSTNGPALSILTVFLYLFFGAIYAFVHIFRNGIVKKSSDTNQEKEDDKV
jgi:hypothetical protein